jgi:adenine phosphoribosyltransferase
MRRTLWFFCILYSSKIFAVSDTYRVKISEKLEKDYEIIDTASERFQVAYIDFRDDAETIFAVAEELIKFLPQKLDFIVILGDKANILGAFVGKEANIPWVILNSKKSPKSIFQSIAYKSITSGDQVLYLNTDQAKKLRGKRVVILDDIISSGETMVAAVRLLQSVDAEISDIIVGFTEGEDRSSFVVDEKIYPISKVGHLPVFLKEDFYNR